MMQVTSRERKPSNKSQGRGRPSPNEPLSRQRILDAALGLVDEQGLEGLSMRRLGSNLGVEAMSLYNHVQGKDALLDGLVEQLWATIELPKDIDPQAPWETVVRPTLVSLRNLAKTHPRLFPLLLSSEYMPESALRVFDAILRVLRRRGFESEFAGYAMDALVSYAAGYGLVELTCGCGQPDQVSRCIEQVKGRFDEVAELWAKCNPNRQFEVGLEALLAGLESMRHTGW